MTSPRVASIASATPGTAIARGGAGSAGAGHRSTQDERRTPPEGTPTGRTAREPGTTGQCGAPEGRWELLRALGSLSIAPPAEHGAIADALGLAAWSPAEHTRLFVLELPPYASIHLGPEGKLGGDGTERVAGIWRALGLDPPADADHLATLLALYAHVGESSQSCTSEAARQRLAHAARALLWEHLWSWVPGYLAAAGAYQAAAPWAALTAAALASEAERTAPPIELPAALRQAPRAIDAAVGAEDLLDALVTPVRSGFVLTLSDLVRAGQEIGVGVRRGERRFALRAMLEQDPTSSIRWLAQHARHWAQLYRAQPPRAPIITDWWATRAMHSAQVLDGLSQL